MYLVRNLNLPKWKKLEDGLLTAQILSTDLRCDKTGMSFWRCQDPKDETALHEVALALAAGRRHLEAISLVWLPAEQLCEAGFAWQYSSGATLVADLKDNHVDVEVLDTNRFVRLAELLQESVQDGKHCKINANRLRKLLLTAIQADRLPVSKLDPPLLTKLLGRLEGEFRRQAEQVYLDSGLNCRLDSFQKAADWYLNNDEKGQLGDLKRQVENRLKESNRPEAAPDGVDLLRAVQERGQAPSTIFAVLADSMEGGESAPSP